MKKLKLIYNPFSGDKSFKYNIDNCIKIFQEGGYDVHILRCINLGDIENHISQMDKDYDVIVASGGDGTVNIVLNAMMKNDIKSSLGIIPSGTANDFATYLNLPSNNVEECCRIITETEPRDTDVGLANDRYFINVCGGGVFMNVSHTIDANFKNALGTVAYYLKGMEQLANFTPIPFRITNSKEAIEENLYFFLVLNSAGAGSFGKLSPDASISDGEFDFIGVKARPVHELAVLFVKILRGEHINDSNIIYFKDKYIKIECLKEGLEESETDVDGETGPNFPVTITNLQKKVKIFGNF